MIMTTKAEQLKQTLCFRSLRLMDKDYLKNNLKSFSDSEIEGRDHLRENNFKKLRKYSSEDYLFQHTRRNESHVFKTSSKIKGNKKTNNRSFRITQSDFSGISKNSLFIAENKVPSSEQLKTETEKLLIKNQNDVALEMSNPYQVLESSSTSEVVNENLLGEPRCLALKKYSGDFNPFLTDDSLVFEPDFEAENFSFDDKINSNNVKLDLTTNPQIKDMFVDDEVTIVCEKKNSSIDREEGELSPEIHQAFIEVNKVDDSSAKLNADFFHKINECLLDLDKKCREFYTSSTPEGALKYLQRTLSNVDSIKRKLTFLISSKNSENEKKRKLRKIVEKYYVSRSSSAKGSERNSIPRHSKSNRKGSEDTSGLGILSSRLEEQKKPTENSKNFNSGERDKDLSRRGDEIEKKSRENNREKEVEGNSKYGYRKRNSRDKLTQAHLLNRKKVDILEKLGTKKEIQRIKSLFERQMSLITKHVIQEKETSKGHNTEKYRRHHTSQREIDKNKMPREKIDLNDLRTLEDMEDFLNTLKNRTSDKILSEQFIRDERKKKLLMFTSKRDKNISLRPDKIIPLAPAVKLIDNSKAVLENPANIESCLAATSNHQKSPVSDLSEFKSKEVDSKVIPEDNFEKETRHTSERLKDSCSKTLAHSSSIQLAKKKTGNVKSDPEIQNDMELNQTHSVEEADLLTCDKSSIPAKEPEINSPKESRHKSRHSHNSHGVDQKETLKRKRIEQVGSKHEESETGEEKETIKRKKSTEYLTFPKISTDSDNNLGIENCQSNLELNSEKVMNDPLIKDLFSKKIFILDDNNLALDNQFSLKVINNEVYLKKISSRRKHKRSRRKSKSHDAKKVEDHLLDDLYTKENCTEKQEDLIDAENTNLEDLENFLQELRSKRKASDEDRKPEPTRSNPQCKELKFLAKIRAKRKAKLMACVTDGTNATEKEAKFLKSLEKREGGMSDSSDVENRKQKLMEKMRAEVDAIVFAEKPSSKLTDDDPLKDVKTFLNMIKEAESVNDESSKQVYVSFSLKRSDVKRLESLTSGKSSSLTEESQKFLNSVRAKMRAKKTPVSNISSMMQKPED